MLILKLLAVFRAKFAEDEPVILPDAKVNPFTVPANVEFMFSSIEIAGVVPTVEPLPITKSSAESSKPI